LAREKEEQEGGISDPEKEKHEPSFVWGLIQRKELWPFDFKMTERRRRTCLGSQKRRGERSQYISLNKGEEQEIRISQWGRKKDLEEAKRPTRKEGDGRNS